MELSTGQGCLKGLRSCHWAWVLALPVSPGQVWGRLGAMVGAWGEMTLRLLFFFLVCVLIEKLSLSKLPFRGDAVLGKYFSSVTHAVAFSATSTSDQKY